MYNSRAAQPHCTIVGGPPGAGKTSFVHKNMKRGDMVIDLDYIYAAISNLPIHDKPESLLNTALAMQHTAIVSAAFMAEDRPPVWIVGGFETRQKREVIKVLFKNVRVVMLTPEKHICLERIRLNPQRRDQVGYFNQVISEWYDDYEPEVEIEEKEFSV